MWVVAAAPVAETEELYDDAGVVAAAEDTAQYEDETEEMYQDAGDTRTYRQTQGVCARALYDYQAGQYFPCFI